MCRFRAVKNDISEGNLAYFLGWSQMHIYLDESGDLGWKFDKPYRYGGSSRYLSIALIFVPRHLKNKPKDLMRKLYKKYAWTHEKKASDSTDTQRLEFCAMVRELLKKYPEIKISCITVKKENVYEHIRQDSNLLYNYMIGLVLPDYIEKQGKVFFSPDIRSVKIKSGNSLIDYLRVKIWLEHDLKTSIIYAPDESHKSYSIQFADWIVNNIWLNFENNTNKYFDLISAHINLRRLFF
ncbi:MAG: DUF3800 domain-containing protein [Candidatus Margulisbacteria bacterium]|jgi:hypothetical protein|nr:DUF3800 domain-containing protein [Candidatus Margulisiibacteriota bacterium]